MSVNQMMGGIMSRDAVAPPKQSQVTRQFEVMGQAIEQLEKSITGLADRLEPVLRPSAPGGGENKKETEIFVPFADRLRLYAEEIAEQTERIHDLESRCEL